MPAPVRSAGRWSPVRLAGALPVLLAVAALLGGLFLLVTSDPAHTAPPPSPFAEGEFAGSGECTACHEIEEASYAHTIHARVLNEKNGRTPQERLGCESCHGPAKAHVESGGEVEAGDMVRWSDTSPQGVARGNAACLTCHQKGQRIHWTASAHDAPTLGCTSCHRVMAQVSDRGLLAKTTQLETCGGCHLAQRGKQFRNGHMPVREGKMSCSSCHAPHGSATRPLLLGTAPNDTCYSCHADKRGPFLWEHAPVVENCMNCHDPHGSLRENMLKVAAPRLCQSCHIETRHPTEARMPGNKFVLGRACQNCHQQIHGSNHPSGFAFTR